MKNIILAAAFLTALATNAQNHKLKPFDLQGQVVQSIDYSPDGLLLAAAFDNSIQLWQSGKDSSSFKLSSDSNTVMDLAFSNDNRHLLAAHGNSAKIWNIEKREVIRTFEQQGTLLAVAYSPDNSYVALGGKDNTVQVWQTDSGILLHTFKGHHKEITDLKFSLDGGLLISASADKTIKVWDLQEKKLLKTLKGHRNWVKTLALSRDSTHLVSAGFDRHILVWNLPDKEVTSYTAKLKNPHSNWISALDISNNNFLVSVGHDNKIALYNLNIKADKKGAHFFQEKMFQLIEQQPNGVRFNPNTFQVTVATLGNGIYYDNYFQLQIKTPHEFKIITINGEKVRDLFTTDSNTASLHAIVSRPEEIETIIITNVETNEVREYTDIVVPEFSFELTLPGKSNAYRVVIEDKDKNIKPVTYYFKVENSAL